MEAIATFAQQMIKQNPHIIAIGGSTAGVVDVKLQTIISPS